MGKNPLRTRDHGMNSGKRRRRRRALLKRDGAWCRICGLPEELEPLTIDHIKPIARGGSNELENMQLLCGMCNHTKGAQYP